MCERTVRCRVSFHCGLLRSASRRRAQRRSRGGAEKRGVGCGWCLELLLVFGLIEGRVGKNVAWMGRGVLWLGWVEVGRVMVDSAV